MPSKRIHLFLNLEGVLVKRGAAMISQEAIVGATGELWQWAGPLIELARKFDLAIVIRSSWALQLSLDAIVAALPRELGDRVVGAADPIAEIHLSGVARIASQFAVIHRYVNRHGLMRWCAVDDRAECWPAGERWRLVHTNPSRGLEDSAVCDQLGRVLTRLAGATPGWS